jgi:hypothetical protein
MAAARNNLKISGQDHARDGTQWVRVRLPFVAVKPGG